MTHREDATWTPSSAPAPDVPQWEAIANNLHRIGVPGGWLYRSTNDNGALALAFVPESR